MAELLAVKGWSTTHSLGLHLRDTLTDEYYVVCDPMVRGVSLDALVVGPQGLFVLHARDWGGDRPPSATWALAGAAGIGPRREPS